jgi:hypothetical protein
MPCMANQWILISQDIARRQPVMDEFVIYVNSRLDHARSFCRLEGNIAQNYVIVDQRNL